jgi:inner membrane protein involved in colicin E2 resistance
MKSKQIAWMQVYLWVGIAALLFFMFVVAFSDEQRIMAFLFPAGPPDFLDSICS